MLLLTENPPIIITIRNRAADVRKTLRLVLKTNKNIPFTLLLLYLPSQTVSYAYAKQLKNS
jgi:hypothetical protein